MQVGIVGLGNVGTAIANLIASNGYDVLGWEFHQTVVNEINNQHQNTRYLPDLPLDRRLRATETLAEVFETSDVIFNAVPSAFMRSALEPMQSVAHIETLIVNLAKGIDSESGLTAYQTLAMMFPANHCLMLGGPAIANEFARGQPTVVVLAGAERTDLLQVARLLDSPTFRTRFSNDVMGVELGGILKNIYSIGLGLFDGRKIMSVNFRAVYLTTALEEITRIGVALGGQAETFSYLAGMGDLLATSLSQHSHNRRLGELLAQNLSLDQIRDRMGLLPEGYNTMRLMLSLAEKMHVSLPLAHGLWQVLHGEYSTERFISSFTRNFVN